MDTTSQVPSRLRPAAARAGQSQARRGRAGAAGDGLRRGSGRPPRPGPVTVAGRLPGVTCDLNGRAPGDVAGRALGDVAGRAPGDRAVGNPGPGSRGAVRGTGSQAGTGRQALRTGRQSLRTGRAAANAGLRPPGPGAAAVRFPAARQDRAPAAGTAAAGLRVPRITFVLLVLALLGGGLVCLLVVYTTLGATGLRISQLQTENANLSLQEQTLLGQVAQEQSPQRVEERAYQLGMRPQAGGNILDLRTGRYYQLPDKAGGQVRYAAATPSAGSTSAARRAARRHPAAPPTPARHAARAGLVTQPKRAAAGANPAAKSGSGR